MIYDNIIEKRSVNNGFHSIILEIAADDYKRTYDEFSDAIAYEIASNHLENRGDDGKVSDVRIKTNNMDNIVRILANVHYLGNDHTEYRRH